MEGRIYDPEVGRFLSLDPNVQYPDSSQGYNRHTYVNNNPLSLSDPTGYFTFLNAVGVAAAIVIDIYAPEVGITSTYGAAFASGAVGGFISSGANFDAAAINGTEAMVFTYVGGLFGPSPEGVDLFERSVSEGLIGGAFSEAGGGSFGDGFVGAFAGSEASTGVDQIAIGNTSAAAIALRTAVAAIVGGTVSSITGGDFADGALAAAMQRLYNDEQHSKSGIGPISGYPETGGDSWRSSDDPAFIDAVTNYDAENDLSPGDALYVSPKMLKAWAMIESGGSKSAFLSDPLQVNNAGDWVDEKATVTGLTEGQAMTPSISAQGALKWLYYKSTIHDTDGNVVGHRSLSNALSRYNGNPLHFPYGAITHAEWYADQIIPLGSE